MRIKLIENEKVVWEARELVKIFNEYFSNIKSNLDIQRPSNIYPLPWPGVKYIKKMWKH